MLNGGQGQTSTAAADPEVPQSQGPEDNTCAASAVPQTPPHTTSIATVVPTSPKDSLADPSQPAEDKKEPSEELDGEPEPQAPTSEKLAEAKHSAPPALKNWADVARGLAAAQSAAGVQSGADGPAASTNSSTKTQSSGTAGVPQPQARALVEVLRSYSVDAPGKVAFIEPRGLYNSAVDCYINSVGPDFWSWNWLGADALFVADSSSTTLLPTVLRLPHSGEDAGSIQNQQ